MGLYTLIPTGGGGKYSPNSAAFEPCGKLYEANWLELSKQGSLATVQCVEVHCPMTKEFFEEYLNAEPARKTQLYIMNPAQSPGSVLDRMLLCARVGLQLYF